MSLCTEIRDFRFGPKLIQIWAQMGQKSWTFSDLISVHSDSASQNVLNQIWKSPGFLSHLVPNWPTSRPNQTLLSIHLLTHLWLKTMLLVHTFLQHTGAPVLSVSSVMCAWFWHSTLDILHLVVFNIYLLYRYVEYAAYPCGLLVSLTYGNNSLATLKAI